MNNVGYEVIGREETTNRRTAALSEEEQLWLEDGYHRARSQDRQETCCTKCKLDGWAGNSYWFLCRLTDLPVGSLSRNVNPDRYN